MTNETNDFDRCVDSLLVIQERDPELAALVMPVVAVGVRHDRFKAALEQIRDHGRLYSALDPEWAARIAEAALLPAETSEA